MRPKQKSLHTDITAKFRGKKCSQICENKIYKITQHLIILQECTNIYHIYI